MIHKVADTFFGGFLALLLIFSFSAGHYLAERRNMLPAPLRKIPRPYVVWLPALPALIFSMIYAVKEGNPAETLLAILAIAAAAEHLLTLERHSDRVTYQIGRTADTADELGHRLQTLVQLHLDFDIGIEQEVLRHYAASGHVSAVVHYWSVEAAFIRAHSRCNGATLREVWNAYMRAGPNYGWAFHRNMYAPKHFLTDLKLLEAIPTWEVLLPPANGRVDPLAELIGLTWHAIAHTLSHWQAVASDRKISDGNEPWKKERKHSAQIRIASFPLWVHATKSSGWILVPYKDMPNKPYYEQAHAIARNYTPEIADDISIQSSLAQLHTQIGEEYYHAGTPVFSWLAMAWFELLFPNDERKADLVLGKKTLKDSLAASMPEPKRLTEDIGIGLDLMADILWMFFTMVEARSKLYHQKLQTEDAFKYFFDEVDLPDRPHSIWGIEEVYA